MTLTPELKQAVERAGDEPVRVEDTGDAGILRRSRIGHEQPLTIAILSMLHG